MKKRDSRLKETEYLTVLTAILACVLLDVYITFFVGKVIVYTHFFYIPIILAGIGITGRRFTLHYFSVLSMFS